METMLDLEKKNKEIGQHWFSEETMRFFRSRIETKLFKGRYFVTSEKMDSESPRLFTIRQADIEGRIETVGTFQEFTTRKKAEIKIKELQKDTKERKKSCNHSYAWSGKMPCTGMYCCIHCGSPQDPNSFNGKEEAK